MGQLLRSLIPWGTEAIVWVQSFRSGFLDVFFQGVTFLGEENFYLLFLPLIYWCVDKRVGIGLAYISLSSIYLNSVLKPIFRIPRPSDPRIAVLWEANDPSFPSGHAQNAVANWGLLATQFRRRAFVALVALLILLIAFSRLYLGVHYPQDLMGGLLVG
ncbi:MAG: phosphatase PAP2 family protein, partial [Chloroflexota bacterium]|nr:phosphatase PAP2 family protein [Chloroflexota bacterium]